MPRGVSVRFVFYRFQVCYLATGLMYPPLRLGSCLGFWSLLARCSSPHPRSAFHFRFLVHSWLFRLRGPASVQRSLARYPARPEGTYFIHAPVLVRRMGSAARCAAARRLCLTSHFRFLASLQVKNKCLAFCQKLRHYYPYSYGTKEIRDSQRTEEKV